MFIRLKDRAAPIQPESEAKVVPFIIEKKTIVREDEVEEYKVKGYQFEENQPVGQGNGVLYFPNYTQQRRVEKTILSQETKFRFEVAPCIEDRLKMMVLYKEEEAKLMAQEAVKERKLKEAAEKVAALKKAIETGDTALMDQDEDDEDLLLSSIDGVELDEKDILELKKMQTNIKEKKFTQQRHSVLRHQPISRLRRMWRAFSVATSTVWTNDPMTQVLPWMFLGRGELAKNSQFLLKNGFTHILNVTTEIPNYYPGKFVYKRIPIEDTINEDASKHFRTIVDFIRRAATSRGKIFIHCTVGASRAPMAVMLYFIVVRKISLLDIYLYLQAIRPIVGPNKHFLFQLSEMEFHQGLGSSVLHHKDWKHYEYNEMKADDMPWRKSEGLYKTVKKILSPENAARDFIDDLEEAIQRKRALYEKKADRKKQKLRQSHGGKWIWKY